VGLAYLALAPDLGFGSGFGSCCPNSDFQHSGFLVLDRMKLGNPIADQALVWGQGWVLGCLVDWALDSPANYPVGLQ